jgi:hypothetical protein
MESSVDGPRRRKPRPPGAVGGAGGTERREAPDVAQAQPSRSERGDLPDPTRAQPSDPERGDLPRAAQAQPGGPERGDLPGPERGDPGAAEQAQPSRSERRNQAAREALAPLAPGERPAALLVAIAVAALLGGGNAIAYAAGAKIASRHPGAGVLAFTAVMALLAAGMFARRYLAVLAFEALLAVTVTFFTLFLVEASNVEGVLLCLGVIGGGGWLFWKLVRVMGRLSAPRQSSS